MALGLFFAGSGVLFDLTWAIIFGGIFLLQHLIETGFTLAALKHQQNAIPLEKPE